MNVFFDMEFTGLRKNTTVISIGLVNENDEKFYAEFTDYDTEQCDEWIEENVLSKLIHKHEPENNIYNVPVKEIRKPLLDWLENTCNSKEEKIQFISDCSHYDFVLLIDLITKNSALEFKKLNIIPVCHDINQDIMQRFNMSDEEAFDINREQLVESFKKEILPDTDKHNALYDAIIIKQIYDFLHNKEEK